MVAGCPESSNGEHYGIDGKLIKLSFTKNGEVLGHFLGECEYCGCPIHFTAWFVQSEDYNPDTLEEEHLDGAMELRLDD